MMSLQEAVAGTKKDCMNTTNVTNTTTAYSFTRNYYRLQRTIPDVIKAIDNKIVLLGIDGESHSEEGKRIEVNWDNAIMFRVCLVTDPRAISLRDTIEALYKIPRESIIYMGSSNLKIEIGTQYLSWRLETNEERFSGERLHNQHKTPMAFLVDPVCRLRLWDKKIA